MDAASLFEVARELLSVPARSTIRRAGLLSISAVLVAFGRGQRDQRALSQALLAGYLLPRLPSDVGNPTQWQARRAESERTLRGRRTQII